MNFAQIDIGLEYIVIIMALIILYMLYFIISKDAHYTKNIRSIASVVEELNKEIFFLKKELAKSAQKLTDTQRMSDEEIYQEIERSVYDMVQPLKGTLQEIHQDIDSLRSEVELRVAQLESGVLSPLLSTVMMMKRLSPCISRGSQLKRSQKSYTFQNLKLNLC